MKRTDFIYLPVTTLTTSFIYVCPTNNICIYLPVSEEEKILKLVFLYRPIERLITKALKSKKLTGFNGTKHFSNLAEN